MEDHFEDVHGIRGGATVLLPYQDIEVDAKMTFEAPDLSAIVNLGNDKKAEVIRAFFIQCVSRGVVNKIRNWNNSTLNESRSKEFMKEVARTSSPIFFGQFRKYLKEASKKDIDESFSCKWFCSGPTQ